MKLRHLWPVVTALGGLLTLVTSASAQSWTMLTNAPGISLLACSPDGTRLAGAGAGGLIYISTNAGGAWKMSSAPSNYWSAFASTADGSKWIAGAGGWAFRGSIYISTNCGTDWQPANAPQAYWT